MISGYLYFFNYPKMGPLEERECAFCDPSTLKAQQFYENELVVAMYTHKPILPGHCLIIPKRHVVRFEELTDAEMLSIGQTIKLVNNAVSTVFDTSAYLLLQKNGAEVGQTVPHVHVHYIPRKAGDTSTFSLLLNFTLTPFKKPLAEAKMQEIVDKLKLAIQEIAIQNHSSKA